MSLKENQEKEEGVPAENQTQDLEKDLKSKFKDESYFRYHLCKILADASNVIASQLAKNNELLEEQNELIREAR